MPGATSSRIEDALSQLVEHLQPTAAADNDEEADQRYFRAFDTAKYILENAEQPAIVPDENHAADAIRRRRMYKTKLKLFMAHKFRSRARE